SPPSSPLRHPRPPSASPSSSRIVKRRRVEASRTHSRPCIHNYQHLVQSILKVATSHYRCRVSTENPYPNNNDQVKWAAKAWLRACQDKGVDLEMEEEQSKLITARALQVHGELKTAACLLVVTHYGLRAGTDKKTINCTRKLVANLKKGLAFAFEDPATRYGMYQHPIIQQLINTMWFQDPHDKGLIYHRYFKRRIPLVTIALILTAVGCALDEWGSGSHHLIQFSETAYHTRYEDIFDAVDKFEKETRCYHIMDTICKELLVNAW
ncbi:hypothetical protein JAAARDRAFT_138972, partial [Jaapia argillacea MUCL 33604]